MPVELITLKMVRDAARALREARAGGGRDVEAKLRASLDTVWKYTVQCGCACPCGEAQGLTKTSYIDENGESTVHMLCGECLTGMVTCPACRGKSRTPLMEVGDREWCAKCYNENTSLCVCCDERYPNEDMHGGEVCDECFDREYCECDGCGGVVHNDHVCYAEDDEEGDRSLCAGCCSRANSSDGKYRGMITRYGWVPSSGWVKRGDPDDPITLGVELEVDCRVDRDDLVMEVFKAVKDFVIASHDGSLDEDSGVEFRSHPATLPYATEWWGKVLKVLKGKARSHDCEDPHGLHVHVGLKVLTELAQAKLAYFMHSPDSRPYLRALARRDGCQFSKFVDEKGTGRVKDKAFKNTDRYEVLNWTSRTVEFRLFRGTTKASTFLACVEFTHALVRYCLEERDINNVGVKDFVEWVRGEDMYPNLARYDHTGSHEEE